MATTNNDNQIKFRAGKPMLDQLQVRTNGNGLEREQSMSRVAGRDLQRYYALLQISLPQFNANEAQLLADAQNGIMTEPHTAHLLWAGIDDAIRFDGLDKKWQVDGPALVERLRALPPFEQLAIADALERAWNSETYHIEDMVARLVAVGLVRKEEVAS